MTIEELCAAAKRRRVSWRSLTARAQGRGARAVAEALERRADEILRENVEDLTARARRSTSRRDDRPSAVSTTTAWTTIIASVRAVVALDDPVGDVVRGWRLPTASRSARSACRLVSSPSSTRRGRTSPSMPPPLCLKTGNAMILRGGTRRQALQPHPRGGRAGRRLEAGLPRAAVSHLPVERELLHRAAAAARARRSRHPARRGGAEGVPDREQRGSL